MNMSEHTVDEEVIEEISADEMSELIEEIEASDTPEEVDDVIEEISLFPDSADLSELNSKLERLEQQNGQLLRVAADFENYKRRQTKEKEDLIKFAGTKVVTNILPAIDNFERALQNPPNPDDLDGFYDGILMIRKQLLEGLTKSGVATVESVGQPFNPEFHEAVMTEANDEHPDQTVLEEFQKGYMVNGRLIRAAMVKVSQA